MDTLVEQARRQDNVVARWALLRAGMTPKAARHALRELPEIHDGVHLLGAAVPTRRQLRWAAVLTAPDRHLAFASAGAAYGFRPWESGWEIVATHGQGGPRRFASGYMLCRSRTLGGHTRTLDGLPIVSAARTLADLAPHLREAQLDRAVREALRLRCTTCAELQVLLARAAPRNRPKALQQLVNRYARLPVARTRSDPEAHALALLDAAGVAAPRVNVLIAGHEADLSWPQRRLVLELDGASFHQFPEHDAHKQARWEAAGWEVRRLPTDDVYERPERLLAAAIA